MALIRIEKTVSAIQIETATNTTAINTTTVFINSSCFVGQVTFFNSSFDSLMNPVIFATVLVSFVEAVSGTVIISTSLLYKHFQNQELFCFFMRSMLLAEFAILFNLDTVGIVFLVFVGLIISLFAFCAGQSNQHTHSCHLFRTLIYSKLNCHWMIIPQLHFSVNKFANI